MSDDKKAIERANSYREMMNLWAWKDFVNEVELLRAASANTIDTVVLDENAPMVIAEARGERKGLSKILTIASQILEDTEK